MSAELTIVVMWQERRVSGAPSLSAGRRPTVVGVDGSRGSCPPGADDPIVRQVHIPRLLRTPRAAERAGQPQRL